MSTRPTEGIPSFIELGSSPDFFAPVHGPNTPSLWKVYPALYAEYQLEISLSKQHHFFALGSWKHSFISRFFYITQCVVTIVAVPLSLLQFVAKSFSIGVNLPALKQAFNPLRIQLNKFYLSVAGIVSPLIAHRYKDKDIFYIAVVIRIAIASLLFIPYAHSHWGTQE